MDGKIKDECIIALKVYDHCRQQDCLTPEMLEKPFSLECTECQTEGGHIIAAGKGYPITVPKEAVDITIDDFRISKIETERKKDPLRKNYYNVYVKFIFEFKLKFVDATGEFIEINCDGTEKEYIMAGTSFKKSVLLFGSEGSEITIASNLFTPESHVLEEAPYVLVEAKAMLLDAQLNNISNPIGCDCDCEMLDDINLTVGLFTIIKLFRIVNLMVESKGFCIPNECVEISPVNPCDIFDNMEFPYDIFNPPQKDEVVEEEKIIYKTCKEE
ncbi:hypothetical protein [Defluviitalea phaphyphila]|uniref:hypothetical protein n=1 Tax=Defluviitalea phaphyphila TaxID=1473580 RepID=UPI00072FD2C2|nr:hypothetical protein [Defluviitalea phaphyphila]